jgi:hypothetical protein
MWSQGMESPTTRSSPSAFWIFCHSNITKKSKDDWNSPATILLDPARHEKMKVVANGIHAAHWKPA